MPMIPLASSVKNLNRLQQIARVLARHGFGHILGRMNLASHLPLRKLFVSDHPEATLTTGESVGKRLALVCTELGPTFVKLAQMFSTRPDLLPDEIINEFRKLQDQVPPFEHSEALTIVAEEIGGPIDSRFSWFGDSPIACGSIGQVYLARTRNDEEVVVKIRRPGIEDVVQQDLHLLKWMAGAAEQWIPELARFKPLQIVEEFEQLLKREMDYIGEASATSRFADAFTEDSHIKIPKVYWDLTSRSMLTLERISGENFETLLANDDKTVDRHLLARRLADAYVKQFFDMRLFHADPHPGNILIRPPAQIGLIDFGQAGTISDEVAGQLVLLIVAMVYRETEVVVEILADQGAVPSDTDTKALARSLRQLLDKYYGLPLKRLDLVTIFSEIADVIRMYNVTLPREMVIVLKTLTTVAGVALKLDPELDLLGIMSPRLKGLIAKRFSSRRIAKTLAVSTWHIASILRNAPAQLRAFMRKAGSGNWQINIRHENLDRLINELDRSSNRMSFSIVIAAVIVGSSVVISSNAKIPIVDIPLQWVGIAGYLFAGVLGVSLLWAIIRSGRLS